jgi:anaerobic selenocysteine-containing dehydrogenase
MNLRQTLDIARANHEDVIPTVCGMCGPGGPGGGCGIYAFVKDGRFTKVAGMDESPVNKGAVCAKGHAAPQWVYSPDRLKHPLRRIGKKGEGRFEKISWDKAIDHLSEVLTRQKETYGAESLAILSPARRSYSFYLQRFLTAHGSPNYGHHPGDKKGSGSLAKARFFRGGGCGPYRGYALCRYCHTGGH